MAVSRFSHRYQLVASSEMQQREDIAIDSGEKVMAAGYAGLLGLDGVSLVSTGVWYAVTSTSAVGLGITLTGATAAFVISGAGFAVMALALPLAYYNYKCLMKEAASLQESITQENAEREKNHEILFFELLKLRASCASNLAFELAMQRIANDDEVDYAKLISLVNSAFMQYENRTYAFSAEGSLVRANDQDAHPVLFKDVLGKANFAIQSDIRKALLNDLNPDLTGCFKQIVHLPVTTRASAARVGVIAGVTAAGVTLSTGWTFAALVIGAGLAASLPLVGWALLGAGCIVLGVIVGLGMGLSKQKNVQREAFRDELQKRNKMLANKTTQVANISLQSSLGQAYEKHGFLSAPVKQLPQVQDISKHQVVARGVVAAA